MHFCENCGLELFPEEVVCPSCRAEQPMILSNSNDSPKRQIEKYKSKIRRSLNISACTYWVFLFLMLSSSILETFIFSSVFKHLHLPRSLDRDKFPYAFYFSMGLHIYFFATVGLPGLPVARIKTLAGKGFFRWFGTNRVSELFVWVMSLLIYFILGKNIIMPFYEALVFKFVDRYADISATLLVNRLMIAYCIPAALMCIAYNAVYFLGIYHYSVEWKARFGFDWNDSIRF
jgi:hypothetical protein